MKAKIIVLVCLCAMACAATAGAADSTIVFNFTATVRPTFGPDAVKGLPVTVGDNISGTFAYDVSTGRGFTFDILINGLHLIAGNSQASAYYGMVIGSWFDIVGSVAGLPIAMSLEFSGGPLPHLVGCPSVPQTCGPGAVPGTLPNSFEGWNGIKRLRIRDSGSQLLFRDSPEGLGSFGQMVFLDADITSITVAASVPVSLQKSTVGSNVKGN
jgi:hypothetical protein